ncbi:hypothetical protein ABZ488_33135 [Streptomyces griseus]|uniref:hypothetical protein n=1 Tax=Streptomyces griseus TaxID=1911 RepID=UPI0033F1E84B
MVLTGAQGRLLFCSPTRTGSCADITQTRESGLVRLLGEALVVEILADADHQGPGAQTGGRVATPPYQPGQEGWHLAGTGRYTTSGARHTPRAASGSSTASPT